MADYPYYFNESYYIRCKLAQLKSDNLTYTETSLKAAIADAYQQPYSEDLARRHYEDYGRSESLNPNPYFNEYEYLIAKTRQLNSVGEYNPNGGAWTVAQTLQAILDAGMIPVQHYEIYGCYEKDANGRFINPSNAFDANAYWSAKLFQLQTTEPDAGWTMDSMIAAFQTSKLSPVSHWAAYGWEEVTEDYAFVQTVPAGQRVSNDPARDATTGDIVPTNYLPNTPAPRDSNPRPAQKPADVGGLVTDEDISPPPVYPEKSAPVPGDADYVPAPSTIQEGFGSNVIPPSTTGTGNASDHFIVVDNDSNIGVVVDRETGAVLGQVLLEKTTDENGNTVVTLPEEENRGITWLDPVDPDELPPGLDPNMDDPNNNFTPEPGPDPDPDPDTSGITAAFDGNGDLVIGNTAKITGSSVTLDAEGVISAWTGHKDGAVKPAQPLADGQTLTASATTEAAGGTGVLTLTTHKTGLHNVTGSQTVRNHIIVADGAKAYTVTGGNAGDTLHIAQGGAVENFISGGDGDDNITVHGTVRKGGTLGKDGTGLSILSGDGHDIITIEKGAEVEGAVNFFIPPGQSYMDGSHVTPVSIPGTSAITVSGTVKGMLYGKSGKDVITVKDGGMCGGINAGYGDNEITVESGAKVDSVVIAYAGDNTMTIHGAVGTHVYGGIDNDSITIAGDATVGGAIMGREGDDTITIAVASLAQVPGLIDGGSNSAEGRDLLVLGTSFNWGENWNSNNTEKIRNFEAVTVADGAVISGTLSLGNVAAIYTVEKGGKVEDIMGGTGKDSITIHGEQTGTLLAGGGGDDTITVYGTAQGQIKTVDGDDVITIKENGQALHTTLATILSGGGHDVITIEQNATVAGNINTDTNYYSGTSAITVSGTVLGLIQDKSGNDTITIKEFGTVGAEGAAKDIVAGDGDDKITVEKGATVTGHVTCSGGDNTITIHGKVGGNIYGSNNSDTITIAGKAPVGGDVMGNGGDDIITLALSSTNENDFEPIEGSLPGKIDGGDGQDTLVLQTEFSWVANYHTTKFLNFETIVFQDKIKGESPITLGDVADGGTYIVKGPDTENKIRSAEVEGGIKGGSGMDSIRVEPGAWVHSQIDSGAGADTVIILAESVKAGIFLGAGNDLIFRAGMISAESETQNLNGQDGNDVLVIAGKVSKENVTLKGDNDSQDSEDYYDTLVLSAPDTDTFTDWYQPWLTGLGVSLKAESKVEKIILHGITDPEYDPDTPVTALSDIAGLKWLHELLSEDTNKDLDVLVYGSDVTLTMASDPSQFTADYELHGTEGENNVLHVAMATSADLATNMALLTAALAEDRITGQDVVLDFVNGVKDGVDLTDLRFLAEALDEQKLLLQIDNEVDTLAGFKGTLPTEVINGITYTAYTDNINEQIIYVALLDAGSVAGLAGPERADDVELAGIDGWAVTLDYVPA